MVSACLPLCRPLVQKSSPLAHVRRIFGSQTSKGATKDSGALPHIIGRFIRREHGEELQGLPNHPPKAVSGWHTIEIRRAHDPKTTVDESELGEIAESHDGIAVE